MTIHTLTTTEPPAPPASGVLPGKHFIMHRHSQQCRRCSSIRRWSFIYRTEQKGLSLHLLPVDILPLHAPVFVQDIPTVRPPICLDCISTHEAADGDAQAAAWEAAKRKKLKEMQELPRSGSTHAPKPAPTLDDLA